ncbi:N-acetylmuramoyl-L-alanine amidase [Thorsellia kenyensis]|uniref:N-acetylmuramoyl-L-alanine amidase n=1 Tax=Thorsellia kenyensis TaxID=1549888 RepID=A0ABV6CC65_9GAMM
MFTIVCFLLVGISFSTQAAGYLINLEFTNRPNESSLTLAFNSSVKADIFFDAKKQQLNIDFDANNALQGLPFEFSGANLMKALIASNGAKGKSRLIVPVSQPISASKSLIKKGENYFLLISIKATTTPDARNNGNSPAAPKEDVFSVLNNKNKSVVPGKEATKNTGKVANSTNNTTAKTEAKQKFIEQKGKDKLKTAVPKRNQTEQTKSQNQSNYSSGPIVIAIDAGHGGKDPGAVGPAGQQEKKIVFAVSKKLEKLLENDPMFKPVLTRTGDYFISVPKRSEIAREQKANLLVSIHADAAPNKEAKGASVWVLSNKRADTEMAGWLEKQEKQSELLGGAGDVLSGNEKDKYLSQAVIDLQFAHAQKVGYGAALEVLKGLDQVGKLHKKKPAHASLGVLRSPDIPSLLVEVGFVSNKDEAKLISSEAYQNKLAEAIYAGLKQYFLDHPVNTSGSLRAKSMPKAQATKNSAKGYLIHKVKKGDTLIKIAHQYQVNPDEIKQLNKMKSDNVLLGQSLKIPK